MINLFLKIANIFIVQFFLLLLFFTCCSHSEDKIEDEDYSLKEIDIIANLSNRQIVKLSDIASGIEYCMLETDEKCFVTGVNCIHSSEDYVVAYGGDSSNRSLYVFERKSGNFVRQISSYGQGPGEYTELVELFWDEVKEQVCVFGSDQYYFYNIDGTLSHQANRFKHRMYRFIPYEAFYVGYVSNPFGNETIRISFCDKTGVLTDSIPNYRSFKRVQTRYTVGGDTWLYTFNQNLYFKELYCDTLYHIKNFTLHPRYVFNTGGRSVPYEIQEGGRYDLMEAMRNGGVYKDRYEKYVCISKIFEDNNSLYFTIEYRRQLYPAIYNKTKAKLQIMPPVTLPPLVLSRDWKIFRYGLENDLDGGLPFWPQQMISDREMMCAFTAEELLALDASKITDVKLKNVLNCIDEDSNPVVVIVTLRE